MSMSRTDTAPDDRMRRSKKPSAKRQNDPTVTRANILAVARTEFVEHGFSGARVDTIAARTKTSKRMLYYYFGNKEGLYREVLRASYEEIRRAEKSLDLEGLPPDQALSRLVRFTVNHHASHPDYVRLLMIENIHHGRYVSQLDEIRSLNAGAIEVLGRIYQDGCRRGLFRTDLKPIDLHWLISALAFFAVSNQATFGWLFEQHLRGSKAARADRFADEIVLSAVSISR